MKRTLLIIAAVTASALTMYGQGRVYFSNVLDGNAVTVDPTKPVNPAQGDHDAFLGSDYSIQLLGASGTFTDPAAFLAVATPEAIAAFYGTTGTGAAHGPNGDGSGLYDFGSVVPVGPAGTYTFMARAWYNGGTYSSFTDAESGGANVGMSQLTTLNVTESPTPAPTTSFSPFTVAPVPEPTSFALAGLGLAGLLIFRRRK